MGNRKKALGSFKDTMSAAFIAAAAVLSMACSPEFNKKKVTIGPAAPVPVAQIAAPTPRSYDVNVSGGGVDGTSANFRMRAISVGFAGKPLSTSTNRTVKAGMMGVLAP